MVKPTSERQWYRMSVSDVLQTTNSSESGLNLASFKNNIKSYGYIKPTLIPKWLRPYFTYKVLRFEKVYRVKSDNIVYGDVISMSAGDVVPALIRVVKVRDARVQEKDITGSSVLISKNSFAIGSLIPVGQQKNMLFPGTYIVNGQVTGVVVGNKNQNSYSRLRQSNKLARHGILASTKSAKDISKCNAVIFDGLTKTKDIKESLRTLYINNHISCLYLTSQDVVNIILNELPEVQILTDTSSVIDPGAYVLAKDDTLTTAIKNFLNIYKALYIGPGAGQNPASLASSASIIAGDSFDQINLLNTKAIAIGVSAVDIASILYNNK
jgi:hypothetical protein